MILTLQWIALIWAAVSIGMALGWISIALIIRWIARRHQPILHVHAVSAAWEREHRDMAQNARWN